MDCYRMEEYNYDQGYLDVDATYILHLEGNGRLDHIKDQLEQYHPSRKVYIVYNKGYKKCQKKLHRNAPAVDLIDAFLKAFQDAQNKRYKNILILEDDFQFHPDIKKQSVQQEIHDFLSKRDNEDLLYYLGCLPFIRVPGKHSRFLLALGMHACIYTESLRNRVLSDKEKLHIIEDWDVYNFLFSVRYGYHTPLCYQLFPETENSNVWKKNAGIIVSIIICILNVDKKVEPGYTIMYAISLIVFYLFICSFLFLVNRLKIRIPF